MTVTTIDVVEVSAEELRQIKRLDAAGETIASAAKWSVGAALIPIPVLDMAALGAIQANMIVDLADLYDQKISKQAVRGVISVLLGMLVPAGATQMVVGTSAKLLPGYGTIVGAVSLAAFGSAATYSIGKVFVRHFENGGTFANFSVVSVQDDLKKEFTQAAKS
jgi:uncharacterized protein (DUF697 family)